MPIHSQGVYSYVAGPGTVCGASQKHSQAVGVDLLGIVIECIRLINKIELIRIFARAGGIERGAEHGQLYM